MKKWPIIFIFSVALSAPACAFAAPVAKLPFQKGQSFVVSQGYDTPPTHIKKDLYALDLTQNGCDAYGKAAVAAASGTVMFASQEGYNGGYGTELIIDHGGGIVSRYAHMIPDSITVATPGAAIRQGQMVGLIGDTGLVAGAACAAHPGTHIHFAMDTVNADGTFTAYNPEPISGYTNMTVGKWYLSDNGDDSASTSTSTDTTTGLTPAVLPSPAMVTVTSSVQVATSFTPAPIYNFSGGVPVTTDTPPSQDATSTFDAPTSTPDVASTTDADVDANATSTQSDATSTASSSVSITASTSILFAQRDDSATSIRSFYDDNWFTLGNGFAGTLNTLTLKGAVSSQDYLASHVALQEFKDSNYTAMVQSFPISDDAPFTYTMATATFSGLSIPLKPYFYYRLATVQDWQNRSVILAGTATTTTGTMMWNNFIYNTGRVEYTSPFYPFMVMEGAAATSTLAPPPITAPGALAENFDALNMQLTLTWSTSTDPDWPANPLHYEMNYSTSTALASDGWTSPGPIPLAMGNTYLVGIRAADNFGDVSAAATATWSFPAGFAPYILSPQMSYAYQYFTVPATSTLQSIQLFTANWQTGAHDKNGPWCTLQLFDEYDLASQGMTPADNGVSGYACAGAPVFSFASSSPVLYPTHRYHWVFTAQTGNPSTNASVQFYGTETDTAGGAFGDPSLANAKFTVTGSTGVLFSN